VKAVEPMVFAVAFAIAIGVGLVLLFVDALFDPSPLFHPRAFAFERAARSAARAAFGRTYPNERVRVTRVVGRDEDAVVVFVEYLVPVGYPVDDYRFFRVSRTTLTAEECEAPADWLDI
jgi:hypothetical protein